MQHWANKKKSSLCLVSVQSTSFLWYHYHDSWIPGSLLSFNILFNIMKCGRYQIAESNLPFRPWLSLNFTICAMTWKRAEGTFLEYISSTCWFLLAPRLSFHKLHQRVLLLMSIFSFLSSTNFSINYDACYCYILLKPSSQSVMSKIMYYFKFNTAVISCEPLKHTITSKHFPLLNKMKNMAKIQFWNLLPKSKQRQYI